MPFVCEGNIFIESNHLIKRWKALSTDRPTQFVIAATGFGNGSNFLSVWSLWQKHAPASARLHFIACEEHPLTREDLSRSLMLKPELQPQADHLLASYPVLTPGFHFLQFEEGRVNLTLMLGDPLSSFRELLICGDTTVEKDLREFHVDAWFLDGFSPDKNPQKWGEVMGMLSKESTTFATMGLGNSAKTEHKQLTAIHSLRRTPWHAPSPKKTKVKHAIVLGAGLAGCYTAYALARRGWLVTLIDEQANVGCGASGNRQAIVYPKLSSFSSPLNNFMLSAFLFAVRTYQNLLNKWPVGELSGMLQLAYNQKESAIQANLQTWLTYYPELATLVSAELASSIAGVPLQASALFVPHSGWLDSPALCQHLVQMEGIQWVANTSATSLAYDGREWHAIEYHAEVLVIANGYRANEFEQTKHLPLKPVPGQMTSVVSNTTSAALQVPLCADAHIIPSKSGVNALGATYHPGLMLNGCSAEDDKENLSKLNRFPTTFQWPDQVVGHWSGVRAATPDYLPMVGPVADAELFRQRFAGFATDSKRWIPLAGTYYDGLYVCTGFGSRGLTTIPLSSEWLAATINKEPGNLSRTMVQSLSPSRFLRREIIRS